MALAVIMTAFSARGTQILGFEPFTFRLGAVIAGVLYAGNC